MILIVTITVTKYSITSIAAVAIVAITLIIIIIRNLLQNVKLDLPNLTVRLKEPSHHQSPWH